MRRSARPSTATSPFIMRDEGGLIVPFFNDFIDAAAGNKIGGYVKNANGEMMDGYALCECWLNA